MDLGQRGAGEGSRDSYSEPGFSSESVMRDRNWQQMHRAQL